MPRSRLLLSSLFTVVITSAASLCAQQTTVLQKVVEAFSADTDWEISSASSGTGTITAAPDGSLTVKAGFSGKGFETISIEPTLPIYMPGDLKSVSVRARSSEPAPGVKISFRDGYGRGEANGRYFQLDLPLKPGEWQVLTAKIPDDWVRPIAISGILLHNFGTKDQKSDVEVGIADLAIESDISNADPKTGDYNLWKPDPAVKPDGEKKPHTPWLLASFSTREPGYVFAGVEPALRFTLRNWRPETARLTLDVEFGSESGEVLLKESKSLDLDTVSSIEWKPRCEKFGPYWGKVLLKQEGMEPQEIKVRFASVPRPRELTAEQKQNSPYGLNYHAGGGTFLTPFVKAGLVWFREYAFNWEWLERAKGNDNRYNGWPFFQTIAKTYRDAGVIMVPVLQRSIPRPHVKNGAVVGNEPPSRAWTQKLASVILAFPDVRYWELDNEYDLNTEVRKAEKILKWSHYAAYHRKFGEVIQVLGNNEITAVENGQAGIYPDLTREMIGQGAFDHIGVVNVHHYAGVEPPEPNFGNFNTGMLTAGGDRMRGLFSDALRDLVAAAASDGRKREAWITEFGWDTLAGKIVTEEEQAAYLPRGYMLFAASGIDKSFWFYNFDSSTPAKQFFDGCGLLNNKRQPKPALSSLAGLTSVLPSLNYVGSINAGPGTCGYVFSREDKSLVAAIWTIHAGTKAKAAFEAGVKLLDLYANPLPGPEAALGIAPIYAVGIAKSSLWYRQTAYSVSSPQMITTAPGEENNIVLSIQNNRDEAITGEVRLQSPEGWITASMPMKISVSVGESGSIILPFTVGSKEPLGLTELALLITEEKLQKLMPIKVMVREPFEYRVGALRGEPGQAEVKVTATNQSNQPRSATLTLALPETWKALTEPVQLANLAPGESRETTLKFVWSNVIPPGQKATANLSSEGGFKAERPLIPPVVRLAKLPDTIQLDANPKNWPEANRLPDWMLGSTAGDARVKAWLGWNAEGLWGAVEVDGSKVLSTDPTWFWVADSLELFISKQPGNRKFGTGDHQFWLVPLVKERRAYLGRWKRGNEIEQTIYDIPGVQTAARKMENGYVMEFLIPWKQMDGEAPIAGQKLGLNLNLNVRGQLEDREVFWPQVKTEEGMADPGTWGAAELAP